MAICTFALCKITNPHDNFKIYVKKAAELVEKHGGVYIVRGQPVGESDAPFTGQSLVGLRFESEEAWKAYKADYEEILPLREGSGEYLSAMYTVA
jgi:uncharacterized protein (DUF1330 family)